MQKLADLRALAAARRDAALEAGQKAAFGTAALAAALVTGAYVAEQLGLRGPAPAAPPSPTGEGRTIAELEQALLTTAPAVETLERAPMGGPLEAVEPASLPPLDLPIATAPPVAAAPADYGARYIDNVLRLDLQSRPADEPMLDVGPPPGPADLVAAIADLGVEYQAADASVRDVSLFLAADDEAISWSFSGASPNYGAIAYEGDGVEVGNLAVGVALNLENARVAAAYVEREVDTRLNANFGESSREQNFVGALVTVKF